MSWARGPNLLWPPPKLVENKRKVILAALDMSAAFDPLHKTILIPKLRESPQTSRENDLSRQKFLVR
jgi:hypothetical protein